MEGCGCKRLLLQFVLLVAYLGFAHSSRSEEIANNQVETKFEDIFKLEDWPAGATAAFLGAVKAAVNDYCDDSDNYDDCQITDFSSNSSYTVDAAAGSPEYYNGDIKITIFVEFPEVGVDPAADNEFILQKSTVITILKLNQTNINSATNQTLIFVEDERLIPIDKSLDMIMIPVVCCLFLLVVVLAIGLQCNQSRGEKHQQLMRESAASKKGEEGITLTAVKSGNYDSGDNNETEEPQSKDEVKA